MSRPDSVTSSSSNSSALTTSSAQLRKIKKPLIERRRRERINVCLGQLKSLVLEALNKNESCYSKMEKADILEMTVTHLRNLQQRHHVLTLSNDLAVRGHELAGSRFVLGFSQCAREVQKYLGNCDISDHPGAKMNNSLIKYLDSRLDDIQKVIRVDIDQEKVSHFLQPVPGTTDMQSSREVLSKRLPTKLSALKIMVPDWVESRPNVTSVSPCFLDSNSSTHNTAAVVTTRPRFVLGQLPSVQHNVGSALSVADQSRTSATHLTATSAISNSLSQRCIQSPNEGDEFPQNVSLKSTGGTEAAAAAAVQFLSGFTNKVETNSHLQNFTPKSLAADVWRPW